MPIGHLYIFFGEISIKVFCPFFHWTVWFFVLELYELFVFFGNQALLVASFANIFSHSIGCLFFFFNGFLCYAKAYKFKSHFFCLLLFLLPWESDLRKHCYDLCQRIFAYDLC